MSFIEKLQNKSKTTKTLILWLATGLIMAIIVVAWIFSFSHSRKINIKENTENTKIPSLFESLGRDFTIFKQGLEASLKNIKSESNELEQQLNQYEEQGGQ